MGFDTPILADVRQYCVGQAEDEFFDPTLITHVDSAFLELKDLGVLSEPFTISTKEEKWNDITDNFNQLPYIREWVKLKVKTLFDPPKSSAQNEAYKGQLDEITWRMSANCNYPVEE